MKGSHGTKKLEAVAQCEQEVASVVSKQWDAICHNQNACFLLRPTTQRHNTTEWYGCLGGSVKLPSFLTRTDHLVQE